MIYLDHAAATPVDNQVLTAMLPYFSEHFFNPSAPYLPAKHLRETYQSAKHQLANTVGAKSADLVITSGATESINLAFTATARHSSPTQSSPLILATEHDAVFQVASASIFASAFNNSTPASAPSFVSPSSSTPTPASIPTIRVDSQGLIDLADLQAKITPSTTIVSVALVSGELGIIQPLAKISALIQEIRTARHLAGNHNPLFLHSDASQALELLDVNVSRLGIDLLTMNSAKIYGPKGIGALYASRQISLHPIIHGGGQERGLRSGTENVPALIGFSTAATIAKSHIASSRKKYHHLKQVFLQNLHPRFVVPLRLGHPKHQLDSFCPISFPGLDAERLIFMLEDQDILLSTGAACAASKGQKSRSLQAIGLSDAVINGSLRITFGRTNSEQAVKTAAQAISAAVDIEFERQNS